MKTENQVTRVSKFLSLVLRHEPAKAGLTLDAAGWADVDAVLAGARKNGVQVTLDDLRHVVETNDKKRFAFSEDGSRIRASQGHSVPIDLGYTASVPPPILYHGTAQRFLASIREQGLLKGGRHHVHLSAQIETARKVGSRHGSPIVLTIRAEAMREAGREFFISENGVWLVDDVPVQFIEHLADAAPPVLG